LIRKNLEYFEKQSRKLQIAISGKDINTFGFMNDTIQIAIAVADDQLKDQLIAHFSENGFDAFEEKDNELICFIKEENLNTHFLKETLSALKLTYQQKIVKDENWNALWESNFPPVTVGDFCAIRADFHEPFTSTKYEIVITPKMSFGTGHHATTYTMIKEMSKLDFTGKKVADFGTGTGVLAILAEKLGAALVMAIDNDHWSITNATENIEKNHCERVVINKAESFPPEAKFDIILANINRNVILSNTFFFESATKEKGEILLSGLLKEDEREIIAAFTAKGLIHKHTAEKNNWICLLFQRR
jgi:ribosomal protein L11 methyltransferase